MSRSPFLVPVMILGLSAAPAAGQVLPSFSPPNVHPDLGSTIDGLATGDLNGDGHVDVVATRGGAGETGVNVSLGNGMGQLTFRGQYGAGERPTSVALADLNGDGRLDAVTANWNQNFGTTFSVLYGDGSGALAGETTHAFSRAYKVTTGDVDNDGDADVVVMAQNSLTVYLNDGAGGLTASFTRAYTTPNCCTFSGYADVEVADVTSDGNPDLAVTINTYNFGGEPQIQVMRGNGNGTFQATIYYRYPNHPTVGRPVGYHTTSIAVSDVNGDLWPDLILGPQRTWVPVGSPSAIVVMRNQNGDFPSALGTVHYLPGIYGAGAHVGDLNDDSHPDLVGPITDGILTYFLNDGVGNFAQTITGNNAQGGTVGGVGYVQTAALADLNSSGPGSLDVIMGRYFMGSAVSVMNGTPAIPCSAGSYSASGNEPCTDAQPGYFVAASGATSQVACPVGTYSGVAGAEACTIAPAGSFVAMVASTSATLCPAGSYSSTAGSASCTLAPAGYFVATDGATAPTACPAGFGSDVGATSCYPLDNDGDGVNNDVDAYPDSNMNPTVSVGACTTNVPNRVTANGATFNDLLGAAVAGASNHGAKVSAVSALSNGWKSAGLISGRDHGAIVSCTARSK
jgi:hypothetical protein